MIVIEYKISSSHLFRNSGFISALFYGLCYSLESVVNNFLSETIILVPALDLSGLKKRFGFLVLFGQQWPHIIAHWGCVGVHIVTLVDLSRPVL